MPCGWPVNRFESTRQAWAGFLVVIETPLPSDETWVACLPVEPSGFGTTIISNGAGDFAIRAGQAPFAADELVIVVIADLPADEQVRADRIQVSRPRVRRARRVQVRDRP